MEYSVSCTTRAPRPGEVDGRDYRFVSRHRFDQLVEEDAFLEWADVYGHAYGTLAGPIADALDQGRSVILEVDMQGAASVREAGLPVVLVFLQPPSFDELARRLRSRGTEDEITLAARLAKAEREMEQSEWFDHVVVNDDVERAAQEVAAIIDGVTAG
jgi:guanylate kinase